MYNVNLQKIWLCNYSCSDNLFTINNFNIINVAMKIIEIAKAAYV